MSFPFGDAETKLSTLDLFSGCGGLSLGLEQAGLTPKVQVDVDKWSCATLRANSARRDLSVSGVPTIIESDARRVDFSALGGSTDVVVAGPPCQPFSGGGDGRAFDDRRDCFDEVVRAVREVGPRAFIIENVPGLLRSSLARQVQHLTLQLELPELEVRVGEDWTQHMSRLMAARAAGSGDALTYKVAIHRLNAADYGVPQVRRRVFLIGLRSDVTGKLAIEQGEYSAKALLWHKLYGDYWERNEVPFQERVLEPAEERRAERLCRAERPNMRPWVTTRETLAGLPPLHHGAGDTGVAQHVFRGGARTYPGHTGSFIDAPAKTLKAGVNGTPGGENMLRFADGSVRHFSIREMARIQGFPDDYTFCGSTSQCTRQLGNAVPIPLARVVGAAVAAALSR